MVCPLCGRKSEVGLFCSACYLKKNLKIEVPNVIEISHCKACDTYLLQGRWVKGLSEEDAIERAMSLAIKSNINKLDKTGVLKIELSGGDKERTATIKIIYGESEIEKKTIVRVKDTSCPNCSRMAGGYYEAVLQMRGGVGKSTVDKIINKVEQHKDKLSFVSEIRKVPGGYDIYLGSKKSAEKIVKEFRGKGEIKKSFEQVSIDRQTSKKKYRFYYLIRL